MKYGDAWEKFPIQSGEVWGVPANGSKVAVHDILDQLPTWFTPDFMFVDPPYNRGQLSGYYTKAGIEPRSDYNEFTDALLGHIKKIAPKICYIEAGYGMAEWWHKKLSDVYPVVQRWNAVYYCKYPTNILRGGHTAVDFDYTGMDEAKVILKAAGIEHYTVMGDLCMGQGLVGVAAYKAGKPFVGTELNKRRLANLLEKLDKLGAEVARYV